MATAAREAARVLRNHIERRLTCSSSCAAIRTHRLSFSSHTSPVPETMSYLRSLTNGDEVFLVGTAHISRKSADEVRSVIRSVRPETVFLELCDERARAMRKMMMNDRNSLSDGAIPEPLRQLLASLGAPGDMGEKLLGAGLKAVYQMFRMSGLEPGLEFKVALEEANRLGARVVLGDRAQDLTVRRLADSVTIEDVVKYTMAGAAGPNAVGSKWMEPDLAQRFAAVDWNDPEAAVELLKTRRAVRALTRHMREEFPKVAAAMVDERDEIMTNGLLQKCGPGRTVAVVGMAHMDGIERRWTEAQGGHAGAVTLLS